MFFFGTGFSKKRHHGNRCRTTYFSVSGSKKEEAEEKLQPPRILPSKKILKRSLGPERTDFDKEKVIRQNEKPACFLGNGFEISRCSKDITEIRSRIKKYLKRTLNKHIGFWYSSDTTNLFFNY